MPEGERWHVIIHRRVEKLLYRLPDQIVERFSETVESLVMNPRPHGYKKLSGHENLYRVRIGDWRLSYVIEDEKLIVLVLEFSPRGDAYRKL